MTSGRRGERPARGTGAGAGARRGSDGEAGGRGDEFADALALANEGRAPDLAATYGDALALTEADGAGEAPERGADSAAARAAAGRGSGRAGSVRAAGGGSGAGAGTDRGPRRRGGEAPAEPGTRADPGRRAEREGARSAAAREVRAGSRRSPGERIRPAAGGEDLAAPGARGGAGRRSEGRGAVLPDGVAGGAVPPASGRGYEQRRPAGSAGGRDDIAASGTRGESGRGAAQRGGVPVPGAGDSSGSSARTGPSGRGASPGGTGGAGRDPQGRGSGDPLDVALGLDAPGGARRSGREPHDPRGLSWDSARRVAVRSGRRLPAVAVPAAAAYGQVLAEPLAALVDLPPFDTSAMDGYAVAGPGPWRLDTAGQGILAGHGAHPPLPDGHAVRIATGARVPPGATGVLRSEHAELRDDGTLLATPAPRTAAPRTAAPRTAAAHDARTAHDVRTGQDIRPRGQECRAGAELLPAGERVTPAVLGLAAAAGHDELRVVRRPRVEVLVLGAELLHRGLPREGRIRDALGPMLEPWLRACGAEPFVTRRLGDDAELLYEAIATSTADVVVTTGGTAAGPVDHVHGTLRRLKADLLVDGVAVRPGHPMLLAVLPTGAHVVGLPGNPLAAVSGLLTLAEPLVRVLGGAPVPEPPEAVLTADVKGHPTDTRLVPVALEAAAAHTARQHTGAEQLPADHRALTTPRPQPQPQPSYPYPAAHPLHFTGPAMLRGLAVAGALAVVPPGGARAGVPVRVLRLPWTAAPAAPTAPAATPAGPA